MKRLTLIFNNNRVIFDKRRKRCEVETIETVMFPENQKKWMDALRGAVSETFGDKARVMYGKSTNDVTSVHIDRLGRDQEIPKAYKLKKAFCSLKYSTLNPVGHQDIVLKGPEFLYSE